MGSDRVTPSSARLRPIVAGLNLLVIIVLGAGYIQALRIVLRQVSLALLSLQPWPFLLKIILFFR